jgi:hypothetical protein
MGCGRPGPARERGDLGCSAFLQIAKQKMFLLAVFGYMFPNMLECWYFLYIFSEGTRAVVKILTTRY